jgi:hypothetical protein
VSELGLRGRRKLGIADTLPPDLVPSSGAPVVVARNMATTQDAFRETVEAPDVLLETVEAPKTTKDHHVAGPMSTTVSAGAAVARDMGSSYPEPLYDPAKEEDAIADPLIGLVVADRYRIIERIGRGGMGIVYRVEHIRIGKQLAMKLLAGELSTNKEPIWSWSWSTATT